MPLDKALPDPGKKVAEKHTEYQQREGTGLQIYDSIHYYSE